MSHQELPYIIIFAFFGALCVRYLFLRRSFDLNNRFRRYEKLPPWQPHALPLLGHSPQLMMRPLSFFRSLQGPTRLQIPTADPFVIVGSNNIRKFFKTTPSSNPTLVQSFVAGDLFGMPPKASATFLNDPSGRGTTPRSGSNIAPRNRVCYLDHEIIQSMLKGHEATEILQKLTECVYKRLDSLALNMSSEWQDRPDLFEFHTSIVSPALLEVFFGPLLTEYIDTEFVPTFWKFDSWVAAIAKRAPRWLFPQGFQARDRLIKSLIRWRKLAVDMSSNGRDTEAAQGIMRKLDFLKADDWDMEAIAATDLGFIASFNSNPVSSLFWLNYEIFRRPLLLAELRKGCLEHLTSAPSSNTPLRFDVSALRSQPLLQSSIAEALRLRTHVFILRYPDEHDMHINEWHVPKKNLVMACSTTSHMDPTLWDTGPSGSRPLTEFWAERFLDSSKSGRCKQAVQTFSSLGREGAWMPFGGGEQMCPGQLFNKTAVSLATALFISHFDIELLNPVVEYPVNWSHFGAGVIRPGAKIPFRVRRRS